MPTLQFKGKNIIWNHHLSLPYHALDDVSKLSYKPEKAKGNLIVEGDNLLALKSLLPLYASQIKCIYIDPPYNTGNENWTYNDNVNSPLLKDWLGKEVAKDDLTRHDKWLCMMTPRLKLLRDLLADDGAIFISIENNELHNLRSLMDEIFHEDNFVGVLIWRKKEGGGQTDQFFVTEHEYVLAYRKTPSFTWIDEKLDVDISKFRRKDKDGNFNIVRLAKWGAGARREDRLTMHFALNAPDGKKVLPKAPDGSDGRWRFGKRSMNDLIEDDLIHWEKDGKEWIAYEKIYYHDEMIKVLKERSILYDVANTGDASKMLTELFGKKDIFQNPKPVDLIKFILEHSTDQNSIILDSFAGSGTTAHAVYNLNKEDVGNRKFILIQMTEATPTEPKKNICKDITRERVKMAIDKFGYKSGFEYMRVGLPMDAESLLSGKLPAVEQFGSYIYYLCTGEKTIKPVKKIEKNLYLAGSQGNADIYLIYSQDYEELTRLALNLDWAEKIVTSDKKRYIIYAPACFLDEDYLRSKQIEFVNIPYGLFQRKGNEA